MYLLAPFILQRGNPQAQNDTFVLNNFFGTNRYYYFHLPIGLLHCAKFKKNLTGDSDLWGCTIFGPKMVHLPFPNFFWKIININLIYLLALFMVQNFIKNSSSRSRVMRMCNFWTQNGPYPLMRTFSENLLMSLISFIYAYLHAKNQSQINLLVKYCQLKNAEISLAKSHFWL